VTDCVRDNALPVLNAEVPDAQLSSGRPAWQDLAHALTGLTSADQSFDGNGFSIRYQAGAGEQAIGTGAAPGIGTLSGLAAEPITGSRPRYLGAGVTPPLRPDQPCAQQAVPDLTQRTGGGGALPVRRARNTRRKPVSMKELRKMVRLYNHAFDPETAK
jgi:hypothetical protein